MTASFVAYVDESGDEGFKFLPNEKGSSRWFVLSAMVIRKENDLQVVQLARQAREVVAIEGVQVMVERAAANARDNNVHNAAFFQADLSQPLAGAEWAAEGFSAVLLDPPRDGAFEVVQGIARLKARRLVYVSCNPATLARDAQVLVGQGYRLKRAGILDMFPQTAHVEAMALFEAG